MATTLELATDEILARFTEQWNADTPAIVGGSPLMPAEIVYELTNFEGRPQNEAKSAPWCRITLKHVGGRQATLRGDGALFEHTGIVIVQVFAAARDNTGATVATKLAMVASKAFEGRRTPNVWFKNVRYEEIGREGAWYQINVSAEFNWNERR
jgi:hypothetical protein